jgi:hypothetical protein
MLNTNNSQEIKEKNNLFVDLPGNIWYFGNFCIFLQETSDIRYFESKLRNRVV